jgi:hypothetical protein
MDNSVLRFVLLFFALSLCGCILAVNVDVVRNNYLRSLAEYRACLDANPGDVQPCEDKRLAMEANERAYTNMSAGIAPGGFAPNNDTVEGH